MDFDEAIRAHVEWKIRLSNYLRKSDGSLKPGDIEKDDICRLGQWIHQEAKKFDPLPEFQKLKADHAKFHRAAADVVRQADQKRDVSADIAFGSDSPFGAASAAVIGGLMNMKRNASKYA